MKMMFVFGTRPEAIKLAPLILKAKKHFETIVCVSEQHKEMLYQVTNFFNINIDYNLHIMTYSQSLFDVTANILKNFEEVISSENPNIVVVQGDTTTALAAALSAFYYKIQVAHVEAGLRSFNKYNPFPEEMNRKLISQIATYHFAPTPLALKNLKKEGITKKAYLTGNTVVDALNLTLKLISKNPNKVNLEGIDFSKKIILFTAHRRESFGTPLVSIFNGIMKLANTYKDIQIIYPVHLNPNVRNLAEKMLFNIENIKLIEPINYENFVYLMSKSYMIITDSGGIQEEAPTFCKPVLVIRETTERQEGIHANVAILVGTDSNAIFEIAKKLIEDNNLYSQITNQTNPYGDGKASERILNILARTYRKKEQFSKKQAD